MTMIENVSRWKQSPRSDEPNSRFYEFEGFSSLLLSDTNIIVGRKGAGKTAIARHIAATQSESRLAKILNFTDFPFNKLEQYGRSDALNSAKYVDFWRYLTLTAICELIAKDPDSKIKDKEEISKIFQDDTKFAFNDTAQAHADRSFSINILGTGLSVGEAKTKDNVLNLSQKCAVMCNIIATAHSDRIIYIMFDELDEGQNSILETASFAEYSYMMASLIKSCIELGGYFSNLIVRPVVFLRSDIFDVIDAPNRNKWDDFTIRLDWNEAELENLIVHRIKQEASKSDKERATSKKDIIEMIFNDYYYYRLRKNQRLQFSMIEFLTKSTLKRPRDLIIFVRECARVVIARTGGQKINAEDIKIAEGEFSKFFYKEMIDELKYVIPGLHDLMNAIRRMEYTHFSISEIFAELPGNVISKWDQCSLDLNKVLAKLYRYGYIGNVTMQNFLVFYHQGQQLDFDSEMKICLHRGLQYKLGFSGRKENFLL
jgi:hypothetical protein